MTPKYPIPLDEALRRLADGDPVLCVFQPELGRVNQVRKCTRELAVRTLRSAPSIEESGPVGQERNLGIFVHCRCEIFGGVWGSLFFATRPECRISEARLRAREAAQT